jgi:hypothetical protein
MPTFEMFTADLKSESMNNINLHLFGKMPFPYPRCLRQEVFQNLDFFRFGESLHRSHPESFSHPKPQNLSSSEIQNFYSIIFMLQNFQISEYHRSRIFWIRIAVEPTAC